MKDLNSLRNKIDKIDNEIIDLLNDRFDVVKEIGEYKKENNIPVEDKIREEIILQILDTKLSDSPYKEEIKNIYKELFTQSKNKQK